MNVTYNTVIYSNYLELQKLRNYLSSRTLAVKKPKLIRVYTSLIVCACHLVFVCTVLSCLCYLIWNHYCLTILQRFWTLRIILSLSRAGQTMFTPRCFWRVAASCLFLAGTTGNKNMWRISTVQCCLYPKLGNAGVWKCFISTFRQNFEQQISPHWLHTVGSNQR